MNSFLQNNEWARDPSFNHFWMHYDMSQRWLQQHIKATRQLCQENGSTNDDHCQEFQEPEVTERLSRCEIRSEEVEEREEMSEEMKEFFAKTRNHRQELKEKRQAEEKQKNVESKKKGNQEEYVNIEQITVRGRVEQSADYRDASAEFMAKREKAKKDYGEAATKILSMESAIEMKFESEYARNPQLWPNIPFRF